MSPSFLLLLLLLALPARARREQVPGGGQPGRNAPAPSSSSSSSSSPPAAAAGPSRFPRSRPGRRRGRLYCRVGIGFHLQLHPDGRVDGAHDASPLSPVHGGLPFSGAFPGEQLQHLRLGRAPQPALGTAVVRGAQQAGQSQEGLQPPRPPPACLYALSAPLSAAPAPRARLHCHPPRKEAPAAAKTKGRPTPASEKPWPRQVPSEVSLRVAHNGGRAGARAAFGVTPQGTYIPPPQMDMGRLCVAVMGSGSSLHPTKWTAFSEVDDVTWDFQRLFLWSGKHSMDLGLIFCWRKKQKGTSTENMFS
ncbi:fibroblast growth factor 5 isoform X1 [Larus michahellis]|uniref:fibroblast growth factor 5 isoform X1 n=1 Tax=Larus michahellis TaxID=119627 RepID=UPI003D9AD405